MNTEIDLVPLYEPSALELRAAKEQELFALRDAATPLLLVEITSKKDRAVIHDMEMQLKAVRLEIEKGRRAFTEAMQKQVKEAQSIEKQLISIISIEDDLRAKKRAYDDELKRIEQEEEARRQAEIIHRARQLAEYGVQYEPLRHAPSVTGDIAFSGLLVNLKREWEAANQARIEKENEERIAREKFEEDQKKFREEQEAFEREKRRVEDEKRAIEQEKLNQEREKQRHIELEQAREEARLKAIRDAEIQAERAKIDAERQAREEQEMLERKKQYQTFLESIELNDTNKDQFTFIDTPEGRKFYRLVGVYKK